MESSGSHDKNDCNRDEHDCGEVYEAFDRRQLLIECCTENGNQLKPEEGLHPRDYGAALLENVRRRIVEREIFSFF